jgi:hypothetical protein
MEIVVLNGSPKGDLSVPMKYMHSLERMFSEYAIPGRCTFTFHSGERLLAPVKGCCQTNGA